MLGAPAFEYTTSREDIWEKILDAVKKGYITAAGVSIHNLKDTEQLSAIGLVAGHSYGLIAAAQVPDKNGHQVNIVQLRNPWGLFEWKGDWGDKSDCWTLATKQQVGLHEDTNGGLFWMSITDFKEYFSHV